MSKQDNLSKDRYKPRKYCVIPHCTSTERDRLCQELSFFSLPNDIERRRQWLIAVGRLDLLDKAETLKKKSYTICSKHFNESDFTTKTIRYLNKDAVPTKSLPIQDIEGDVASRSASFFVEVQVEAFSPNNSKEKEKQAKDFPISGVDMQFSDLFQAHNQLIDAESSSGNQLENNRKRKRDWPDILTPTDFPEEKKAPDWKMHEL